MSMRRPMSGVTLSSEYATALRDWRRERERRSDSIKQAREEGMNETDIMADPNLPSPRGWWEYAVDPPWRWCSYKRELQCTRKT